MKTLSTVTFALLISLLLPVKSETYINNRSTLFSKSSFFVKTKTELKISEATGEVSLNTGIKSIDEKINKYGVSRIDKVFKLNNGNPALYEKYEMSKIYLFRAGTDNYFDIEKLVEEFSSDSEVEFSEPNFIGASAGVKGEDLKSPGDSSFYMFEPNDEMFPKQWYLNNTGFLNPSGGGYAKVGADIKMLKAWQIEIGTDEVVVAILDSGIKDDHPDLKDRMWINKNEIPGNGIDDDRNGYVDDLKGWDFAYDDRRPEDGFGHGTNIATVIGASTNNFLGFAGINMKCKLMNCKNLNAENTGEYSWWVESIKYAVDNGAKIINMSEGGDDYSRILETAIKYAIDSDVFVSAAMMNKGDSRDYYPASISGVFAVGATDTDDKRCKKFTWGGGSCYGKHISVVAPGNRIYGLDYENDLNYDVYWSGTSQSTAIVSGIASLLLAQDNLRTSDDLKKIIKLSSKDLVGDPKEDKPGWDKYYGYGRVDCFSALTFENSDLKNIIDDEFEFHQKEYQNEIDEEKSFDKTDEEIKSGKDKPAKAVDKKSATPQN